MILCIITLYFSGGLIPYFILIHGMHLYNTFWFLIIHGMINVYNVIIFRTFFMELPEGLEESARIDGYSNKGDMIITIDKEIQQIQAYIDIQRIKYADRILVEYEVQPSILNFGTVKFILQPFVENVLEHAWFDDMISIRIRGFEEGDMLIFEIIDNGLGMNQETLDQIFNSNGTSIGYGIGNVNERIKLHFGKSYGVSIHSRIGEGTTVRITIPIHILKSPTHPESKKDQSIQLNEV
jgi:signal transduction histidine kinase